jgi:hypothetical protein
MPIRERSFPRYAMKHIPQHELEEIDKLIVQFAPLAPEPEPIVQPDGTWGEHAIRLIRSAVLRMSGA